MRFLIAALLAVSFTLTPVFVHADYDTSDAYRAMSVEERIAYLLGMVAQLQMILVALEAEEGRLSYGDGDVSVTTLSARDIESDEAELRGEVDLRGEDEARVWFEYGEDDDDLDERTSRRRITDSRGDERTFTSTIRNLDEDERYYYRAVAEDESGDREYGSVRSFSTDDDFDDSESYELRLDDDEFETGDRITVEWETSSNRFDGDWIGLYQPGDDPRTDTIDWARVDDDEGEFTVRIYDEGEYEFRYYLDSGYELAERSRRFEVVD